MCFHSLRKIAKEKDQDLERGTAMQCKQLSRINFQEDTFILSSVYTFVDGFLSHLILSYFNCTNFTIRTILEYCEYQ